MSTPAIIPGLLSTTRSRPAVATTAGVLGAAIGALVIVGGALLLYVTGTAGQPTVRSLLAVSLTSGAAAVASGVLMVLGAIRLLRGESRHVLSSGLVLALAAIWAMALWLTTAPDAAPVGTVLVLAVVLSAAPAATLAVARSEQIGSWMTRTAHRLDNDSANT